jgi:outer membrane receptor protein involved in Fe transport
MTRIFAFSRAALGASSAIAIAMGVASPAFAQAQAAATDSGEDEIIVTATKREQQLTDVPLAIQAFSGAALEESGAKELNDLIESIPGASSVSRTAPGFETIQIRGIASGTTGDATVGYYVDDVPFNVPNLQLAPPSRLFDLQRVEVLRGPQGTVWGQGSMGGMIRMVTAAPDPSEVSARGQLEVSGTKGGEANWAVDGVLNVPLAKDTAALRLSGGYESLGGFADSTTLNLKNINDSKSWNLRGKLLLKAGEATDIELGAWRVENSLDFRNSMDSANPPLINTVAAGRPNFIDSSMTLLSGVIRSDLGVADLISSTSYIDHQLTFDASFLAGGILRNQSTFDTKQFTQEVRLASNGDGPLSWIVGGYYSNGKINSDICLSLIAPCTTVFSININSVGRIKTRAWALFGELAYAMMDGRLVATVGGREFQDKRSTSGVNRNGNIASPAASDTFKTFNPRFNLSFKATDDFLLYGNIAKGFRSGAFQTPAQAASASTALGVPIGTSIQPDKVWSYEVGAKGRIADGVILLDMSLYQIDWTNIQLQSTISGVATLSNGGNARAKGIDLGIVIRPTAGLRFGIVGNTNSTEFTSVLPAIVALNPRAARGSRVPTVPKSSLSLTAGYEWTVFDDAKANIDAGYTYRGSQLDSTGLVSDKLNEFNLRAGFAKDGWKVQVFGENIFDKNLALTRGSLGIQPNFPRRIGIRVAADF